MSPKRRDFLKGAGVAALAAGVFPEAIKAKNPAAQLKLPIVSSKILSSTSREVSGGHEHLVSTEIIGANGVKHVTEVLSRDLGAHKIITMRTRMFSGAADTEHLEVQTRTIFAEILDVEGIEKRSVTTVIADENGIRPPRTIFIAKDLKSPAEGAADLQEAMDRIFEHKKLKVARNAN